MQVRLAQMFPDLTIVLNHCGAMVGPALLSSPALLQQWQAGISAVAAAGNKNVRTHLNATQGPYCCAQRAALADGYCSHREYAESHSAYVQEDHMDATMVACICYPSMYLLSVLCCTAVLL